MTIYAAPGTTFEAVLSSAPVGLVGSLGVQILDGQGAVTSARTTSGILETPAASGTYTATMTAPSVTGQFVVFWDSGVVSQTTSVGEDLVVSGSSPVSGSNLTTLAAVRRFLQKGTGVTAGQDALTNDLITRASVMIQNELGREFAPSTGTRTFAYYGGGTLDIGDARAVTSVTYDSDGTSPTVLTSGWYLRPASPRNGVYQSLYLSDYTSDRSRASWSDRVVSVTGSWGFASVPADVEHACIVTVRDWLRSDVAFSPEGGVDRIGGDTISPRILTGLDHYRLLTV